MKVRDVLTGPGKWCKGTYAVTADGEEVGSTNDEAVAFCLLGAIHKAYTHNRAGMIEALRKVDGYLYKRGYSTLMGYNDDASRTFADVRALVEELDI